MEIAAPPEEPPAFVVSIAEAPPTVKAFIVIAPAALLAVVLRVVDPALELNPPVKVIGLPESVTPPVFAKVTAFVIVPPPLKATE